MSQLLKDDSSNEVENLNELLDAKLLDDDDLLGDAMIEDSPLLGNVGVKLQSDSKGDKDDNLLGVAEREGFDDDDADEVKIDE